LSSLPTPASPGALIVVLLQVFGILQSKFPGA
jgi:hypothetical protein